MDEDYSPAVGRGIDAALAWQERSGTAVVAGAHLFLGLLEDEDGTPWGLLSRNGLSPAGLRQRGGELPIAVTASLSEILRHGHELAVRHGQDATLTSDLFLIAILRVDAGLARYLHGLGLDQSALEREVVGEVGPPIPAGEPLTIADPVEQAAAGRVLDAAFNRAREALRVLDDYCRFVLDDAVLTREVKSVRHELAELFDRLPSRLLVSSRDTLADVGAQIGTAREQRRNSAAEVAHVNLKRLQEALRTLEEFGKVIDPEVAAGVEQLRYRSYTLEKAIGLGTAARTRLAGARLYVLLTGSQCTAALDWTIREAAAGGAQIFQLREKELGDRQLLERARDVRRWTREVGALFIVNDRPDIARLAEADGVHLGQDDMPVKEARRILGPDGLIGVSTHDLDQLRRAILDGSSYVGVGPAFPSRTKSFEQLAGLDFVRAALQETSLPAFVIGGVNDETIGALVELGVRRVAVSGAIAEAAEPRLVAQVLREALGK
jgi:thiamine-phosphate pyrophosphorylase